LAEFTQEPCGGIQIHVLELQLLRGGGVAMEFPDSQMHQGELIQQDPFYRIGRVTRVPAEEHEEQRRALHTHNVVQPQRCTGLSWKECSL
jgi:hypothetical protein